MLGIIDTTRESVMRDGRARALREIDARERYLECSFLRGENCTLAIYIRISSPVIRTPRAAGKVAGGRRVEGAIL